MTGRGARGRHLGSGSLSALPQVVDRLRGGSPTSTRAPSRPFSVTPHPPASRAGVAAALEREGTRPTGASFVFPSCAGLSRRRTRCSAEAFRWDPQHAGRLGDFLQSPKASAGTEIPASVVKDLRLFFLVPRSPGADSVPPVGLRRRTGLVPGHLRVRWRDVAAACSRRQSSPQELPATIGEPQSARPREENRPMGAPASSCGGRQWSRKQIAGWCSQAAPVGLRVGRQPSSRLLRRRRHARPRSPARLYVPRQTFDNCGRGAKPAGALDEAPTSTRGLQKFRAVRRPRWASIRQNNGHFKHATDSAVRNRAGGRAGIPAVACRVLRAIAME